MMNNYWEIIVKYGPEATLYATGAIFIVLLLRKFLSYWS